MSDEIFAVVGMILGLIVYVIFSIIQIQFVAKHDTDPTNGDAYTFLTIVLDFIGVISLLIHIIIFLQKIMG